MPWHGAAPPASSQPCCGATARVGVRQWARRHGPSSIASPWSLRPGMRPDAVPSLPFSWPAASAPPRPARAALAGAALGFCWASAWAQGAQGGRVGTAQHSPAWQSPGEAAPTPQSHESGTRRWWRRTAVGHIGPPSSSPDPVAEEHPQPAQQLETEGLKPPRFTRLAPAQTPSHVPHRPAGAPGTRVPARLVLPNQLPKAPPGLKRDPLRLPWPFLLLCHGCCRGGNSRFALGGSLHPHQWVTGTKGALWMCHRCHHHNLLLLQQDQ